jgi:subtilisin family serine protease
MESISQSTLVQSSRISAHTARDFWNLKHAVWARCILGTAALAVSSALFMTFTPNVVHAAPPAHAKGNARSSRGNGEEWARGRILVMPRAGLPARALANILKEHEGKPRKVGQSDLYIVDVPEYTEEGVIARLANHPHLKFAELDEYVYPALTPSDPFFANGWHLPKIEAPLAWDDAQGANVTVAILDTGVDGTHPDLASKMVPGWNFYENNANSADAHGHGTKVAGAAAAATDNALGIAGVAGQARIMPIRIASPTGSATFSAISQGITWAADNGARVANISFLGVSSSSSARNAAQYMKNKGGLVAVSGGNTGVLESFTTTATMIPVAATDGGDNRTSWSSYGNYIMLAAPGSGIWTTTRGGGYGTASGTSFSSPITAGVIALMMSANPAMKNTDIENVLFSTATDLGASGWDQFYGHGRVNAAAAVQAAVDSAPAIDREAPVVAILDPLTGATVSDLVPVDVDATDNVGVVRAELWVNNTSVAVDTTEPFAFSWDSKGVANGAADLVVRAVDAAGNAALSNTVRVNVNNPASSDTGSMSPSPIGAIDVQSPVVQIINPVAGNVSRSVIITVNASDNSGASGIALSIYIDDKLYATGMGSTLSTNWNTRPKNIAAGKHAIKAIARDAAGNFSATTVEVTVIK